MTATYLERPASPNVLLPYMGRHLVALVNGVPAWDGVFIALGRCAHLRNRNGDIAEFPFTETVFQACESDE